MVVSEKVQPTSALLIIKSPAISVTIAVSPGNSRAGFGRFPRGFFRVFFILFRSPRRNSRAAHNGIKQDVRGWKSEYSTVKNRRVPRGCPAFP